MTPNQRAQRQQWIDSYCRVRNHEPTADEIADFEHRHGLTQSPEFSSVSPATGARSDLAVTARPNLLPIES